MNLITEVVDGSTAETGDIITLTTGDYMIISANITDEHHIFKLLNIKTGITEDQAYNEITEIFSLKNVLRLYSSHDYNLRLIRN